MDVGQTPTEVTWEQMSPTGPCTQEFRTKKTGEEHSGKKHQEYWIKDRIAHAEGEGMSHILCSFFPDKACSYNCIARNKKAGWGWLCHATTQAKQFSDL